MELAKANPILPREESRLRHFPVAFFAIVMGLAGLTIAWKRAEVVFHAPFAVSCAMELVTVLAFIFIAVAYLLKLVSHPADVAKELRHPVRLNFFPTISIGLVLLWIVLVERYFVAAKWLWIVGTTMHLGFTLYVMNAWIHRTGIEVSHVNPAWFIPIVGDVLVPISGVRFFPAEVSWFFFSVGIVFWPVLLTIVMYRLFFHAPLPERLLPTLFILVAPPAVGFIAYFALTGTVDSFARILYYTALAFTLLLESNALRFLKARFFLSAWAYSFPLAAVTIATLLMAHRVGGAGFEWIALALLAVLTVVVVLLLLRTVLAISRREICVEEA
ncbi:MAG: SLAC1 anion channel family protein [Burkholderiales bacterium]